MQNQELAVVQGPHGTNDASGVIELNDMMNLSFDQLWGERSQSRTSSEQMSPESQTTSTRILPQPIIHLREMTTSLQGATQMVPFGFGSFDLYPHNLGRIQRGVKSDVLEKLNSVSINEGLDESVCNICMESFGSGTLTLELPCKHMFCRCCISEWLKENDTCPICRYKFPEHETYLTNLHD
eukprot:g3600.t1